MFMDRKVAIVTDTIGCIPEEEIVRYNIREVPIRIVFGDKVYQDRVELKAEEFYSFLKESKQLPTTSAPSPEHFLNAFREMSRGATSILCITLSSKLSSTFNSAKLAAEMAKEMLPGINIEVLDSRTAAAAQGFVVLAAAKVAAAGKGLVEAINATKNVIIRVHLLAVVDTLEYLARGGRIPKVIAWAGSLLNIKPIIALKDGEARPAGRSRTYLGAMKQMIEMMKNRVVDGLPLHVAVMHAAEPEKAGELKKQISSLFEYRELMVTEFTRHGCSYRSRVGGRGFLQRE